MAVVPFQNLPVAQVAWNPSGTSRVMLENEILGDLSEPNWAKYKKAHVIFDPNNQTTKAGYKLIIARIHDGKLQAILPQLGAAVAAINGARGGINIPMSEKKKAYNHIMKYYAKLGIKKEDRPKFVGSLSSDSASKAVKLGGCVTLGINIQDIDAESPKPVWVQVAREGDFPGYAQGEQPFVFTVDHFKEMIENLHSHPSFKLGADGIGSENIIPWDFNHASELFPGYGTLPVTGAPAQGWTKDFKLAEDEDGKTCLMAYTLFLEPALSYIREGRYAWASVAAMFDFVHPETADNVGAIISSIALTNTPFIEGMQRLAASKTAALRRYYGRADDTDDAIRMLKTLFGLPEISTIDSVIAEISKLNQWIETGETPLGINVGDLLAGMREILGLPVLSTEKEVIENALSITSRLIDQAAVTSGVPTSVGNSTLDQISDLVEPATPLAKRNGADMELLKKLAERLGVRESDDAVVSAIDGLLDLRIGVMKALGVKRDSDESILNSMKEVVQTSAGFKSLLTALESEDTTKATERIISLIESANELAEIKPKYEELMKAAEAAEESQIEQDVIQVMSANNFPDNLKEPLMLYRKNDPESFAKKYPQPVQATQSKYTVERHPMLTKTIAADPKGGQHKVDGSGTVSPGAGTIDLAKYPGRNTSERAINCVKMTVSEAKDWKWEDLCNYAFNMKDRPDVVDSTPNNTEVS